MRRTTGWLATMVGALVRRLGGTAPAAVLPAEARPEAVDDSLPYPTVELFRQHIFDDYHFTPRARLLLTKTKLVIGDMREPVGGGLWFGPAENRVELQGIQDEAAVHEFAHGFADFSGFYTQYAPDWPHWKTRNPLFREAVHRAAVENDQRYARISFICREYEFGNPDTGFAGMFENDSERFAGLASGCMGDLLMLPPHLRRWYTGLFMGTRGATEG